VLASTYKRGREQMSPSEHERVLASTKEHKRGPATTNKCECAQTRADGVVGKIDA